MNRFFIVLYLNILACSAFSQKTEDITYHLKKNFNSRKVETPFRFSRALTPYINGVKIVGFGEATHGTREFRQGFVKMAKDLIQDEGFNVVLLGECGFSDTYYLNEYVVFGRECPLKFNKNQSVIDEDFKEFAEWLRIYNSQRHEADRVWMLGSDILFLNTIAQDVLTLSDELGVKLTEPELAMLNEFAFIGDLYKLDYFNHRQLNILVKMSKSIMKSVTTASISKELNFHQKQLLQSTSNLTAGIYWSELWSKFDNPRARAADNARDSSIFKNIQWIRSVKPDAKIVMYAHNAHIEKEYGHSNVKFSVRLGHLLKKNYGVEYFAIATEAGRGEYFYQGKISKQKNRIGNIFYEAGLGEGLIVFKDDQQLEKYFLKDFLITYGTTGSGGFATLEKPSLAFDAFYYVPQSTLVTPLVSRNQFENFVLSSALGGGNKRKFNLTRQVRVDVNADFRIEENSCYGQSVFLTILFFDKDKRYTDFFSDRIKSGENHEYNFNIPQTAETALITIAGRGVSFLNLKKIQIDGARVTLEELNFTGKELYLKNSNEGIIIDREKGM